MFTRLRRHLTYANIAATLAVVFAMSGGAYALSGGGHAPVASESSTRGRAAKAHKHVQGRSVVRGPAGPRGATGAPGAPGPVGTQGPQGAAGSQGPKGAAGTVGAKGEAGSPGTGGKNGEGVTATALAAKNGSGNCEAGGTEFKVGGHEPTYACNGEVASGSGYPEVMPSGRSVSGRWGVALAGFKYEEEIENPTTHEKEKVVAYEGQYGVASISFPIALSETQVSVIGSHS
ncbi:MAG TPA: hypothetical protein VMS02_00545, partial [Solirubrobacteraceae bacterium]|nr:hypothetical protein [Solirubrobacteraceae bacterium]